MSQRRRPPPPTWQDRWRNYREQTRAIAPSLVLVLPLLGLYEALIATLEPPLRNSAELAVSGFLGRLPRQALDYGRAALLLCLLTAGALWLIRRTRFPRMSHWVLLESLVVALLLGPALGLLVGQMGLSSTNLPAGSGAPSWLPFLLSVGAGLWEELVFRLALLGGTAFLLARVTGWRMGAVLTVALLFSSLLFALYHHVGAGGEPLTLDRFAYRSLAGILLGSLFIWRGLAVVVYAHVFYDLLCDLRLTLA